MNHELFTWDTEQRIFSSWCASAADTCLSPVWSSPSPSLSACGHALLTPCSALHAHARQPRSAQIEIMPATPHLQLSGGRRGDARVEWSSRGKLCGRLCRHVHKLLPVALLWTVQGCLNTAASNRSCLAHSDGISQGMKCNLCWKQQKQPLTPLGQADHNADVLPGR